jgi:geranylgeranyl reductase family protein
MYDVIVVGAGPSGASAARGCAQLGMSTLLIDKAVFPRDKICGGALSGQAMSYLDFDLPDELIERDVYGARAHYGDFSVDVRKPYRIAVLVSRFQFDHFLLRKAQEAGVKVLEGRKVSALEQNHECIQVVTGRDRYSARIVIGCDGFNGVTARSVRGKPRKDEFGICVETHIPADESALETYVRNGIDLHLGIAYMGYGWVFPHRGYFSVGVGGLAERLVQPRAVMLDFLASLGFSTDVEVRGFPVPVGGIRRKVIAERVILAGDAAGFVDACQGEGLAFAIRSGQLAGRVAAAAVEKGDCSGSNLRSYEELCEREFGKDLRYSLYFSRLVHRFPGIFLRLLASGVSLFDKFLEIPARLYSYQRFLAWLLPRVPYLWVKQKFRRR